MLKLLRNYIREQKNNLLQVLGLGILVIIMIVSVLSINFANNYIYKQYINEIAQNDFHQYSYFKTLDKTNFRSNNSKDAYLENMKYYDENYDIIESKLENATFQLQLLDNVKHTYRFIIAGGDANSKEYFAIGQNLATITNHKYIDFKVNIPFNYPTIATHDKEVNDKVALLDKYVYDGTNVENKTNFMITSVTALKTYNDKIFKKLPFANKVYTATDIDDEAKLYSMLTMGMLYENIQYMQVVIVNDLLITGKNFAFVQSEPSDIVNRPIITKNGGESLEEKPLQDNEILIYQEFARLNSLHIGQSYVLAGRTFIIRGYATSSLAANSYFYLPTDFKNNTVAISVPVAHFIITTYANFIALISYGWYFNVGISILIVIIPIISITVISFSLILFLLRIKPLDLITNNVSTKKYYLNVGFIFSFIFCFVIRKFTYRNKLAAITSIRSLGKILIMSFTSIFAASLVFFAAAASGLVNDMLGSQFSGIVFNYQNTYQFTDNIKDNFFTNDNKLMYKFDSVDDIKDKSSLYPQIMNAINGLIDNPTAPAVINFRGGYIMGSELLKIRKKIIEPNFANFSPAFQQFWNDNIILIDFLTNKNGQSNTDLMFSFGLVPYEKKQEMPYTQVAFDKANWLDLNGCCLEKIYYDNDTQKLSDAAFSLWASPRVAYGINESLDQFLKPDLNISDFKTFSNLTLSKMKTSTNWQDQQFIKIRKQLIASLGIKNPDSSCVQFIPMATSSLPTINNLYDGGEKLGNTIIYTVYGLDKQTKYIIGVAYDTFNRLQPNIALLPQTWLNSIILGTKDNDSLNITFANSKLSKFSDNEFQHYLPIISTKNDYKIDLSQVANVGYFKSKGISSSLSTVYNINNLRNIMRTNQYSLQVVIIFFGIFSVILAFMIVTIITNIMVCDNLILINILRSLGYSAPEVSYNFFFVMIPIIVISSLVAVFIVPNLVGVLAQLLTNFANILFPVVFRWWYFAIMIFTNIVIYFLAFVITWKLNINNKQLMNLTK